MRVCVISLARQRVNKSSCLTPHHKRHASARIVVCMCGWSCWFSAAVVRCCFRWARSCVVCVLKPHICSSSVVAAHDTFVNRSQTTYLCRVYYMMSIYFAHAYTANRHTHTRTLTVASRAAGGITLCRYVTMYTTRRTPTTHRAPPPPQCCRQQAVD